MEKGRSNNRLLLGTRMPRLLANEAEKSASDKSAGAGCNRGVFLPFHLGLKLDVVCVFPDLILYLSRST